MKKLFSLILCCALLISGTAVLTYGSSAASDEPWVSYMPIEAENEDGGLSIWFEHSTAKVKPTDTASSEMNTYCIRSAKNEIETCQFVLYSPEGRNNLTASVTDFTSSDGSTITPELFYEHYTSIGDGTMQPDALPPLVAPFSVEAGLSKAFLIKVKVPTDAAASVYTANLSIYNDAGEQIKTAEIYLKVWDFVLPEATSCATSMTLDLNRLTLYHKNADPSTIYKTYYDYLLENRICAYSLPYDLLKPEAEEYMNNPRVTSFQVNPITGSYMPAAIRRVYKNLLKNPEWLEKAYFSNEVDPINMEVLNKIAERYNSLNNTLSSAVPEGQSPSFNLISTFFTDITVSEGVDQIDFLDDYINLWCPKPFAFTNPSDIGKVPGAKLLQDTSWDSIYGTFPQRMAEYKARGDKLWWFVSWDVEAPYANFFTQTDGVTHRVLFWQQKDCGVDGFLYNYANFWFNGDPWEGNISNESYPGVYGEGILVYPGSTVGIEGPVGSLRLEAMRDGIEDFEYLTILEEKMGSDFTSKYISKVSESVVSYTHDNDVFAQARIELGDAVERAVSFEYELGDINTDGKINLIDILMLKRTIAGKYELSENAKKYADLSGDGKLGLNDCTILKRKFVGKLN